MLGRIGEVGLIAERTGVIVGSGNISQASVGWWS
jgi:hypothetical protein